MSGVPFIVLGVGAAWCGLMLAMRDRRIATISERQLRLRIILRRSLTSFAAMTEAGRAAAEHARRFQERVGQVSAALGVSMVEAGERLQAALRNVHVETPEQAKQRIFREWGYEFRKPGPTQIVKGITDA